MVILATPAVPFHTAPAFPRLADQLPAVDPVEPPAWWCNPSADYRLSPQDAAELSEYESWLDEQAQAADLDERAAMAAEELDWTPPGADCPGFALCGVETASDPVFVADPDAGLMFADDPAVDACPTYW